MKALTIWQPWASLIMIGAKPFEFRDRSYMRYIGHPRPGDWIVIHAGARKMVMAEVHELLRKLSSDDDTTGLVPALAVPFLERIARQPRPAFQMLPLGCALGLARIGKAVNAADLYGLPPSDSDRGVFNWAWPMDNVRRFAEPMPMRGMQGFWNCSDHLRHAEFAEAA